MDNGFITAHRGIKSPGSLCLVIFVIMSLSPQKQNYTERIDDLGLEFPMVFIEGGEFMMGSDVEEEGPIHKVSVDDFYIGQYEVTWDLFEPFLSKNYEASLSTIPTDESVDAITRPTTPYLDMTFGMGKEGKPVIGMTQYAARQFCHWLYLKTGHFYRLPTEAEWEYAASCGQGDKFSPEQSLESVAWFGQNSKETTHEVGQLSPNDWGLYDILGNAMEWTEDYYNPGYDPTQRINPLVQSENLYPRVLRGGHFKSSAEDIDVTRRFYSTPTWKQIDPQIPKSRWWFPDAPFVGFRVVRPYKMPSEATILDYYNQPPIDDF